MTTEPNTHSVADCDAARELLPAYSIGATDPDETALVEQHLAGCPALAAELAAYRALSGALAGEAPPVAPPPHVLSDLLAAARESDQRRPSRRARPNRMWAALAALAAMILIAFAGNLFWLTQLASLRDENRALAAQIDEQARVLEALGSAQVRWLALPTATNGQATGAYALVIWLPGAESGMMIARQFPLLDQSMTFQAWVTRGGAVTSLGTFGVDSDGNGVLTLSAALLDEPFEALGVTLEPAGGSPGPTSRPVVRLERVG
jgi:anti-sigma-K factor RskA